jgi:hypothetical protein
MDPRLLLCKPLPNTVRFRLLSSFPILPSPAEMRTNIGVGFLPKRQKILIVFWRGGSIAQDNLCAPMLQMSERPTRHSGLGPNSSALVISARLSPVLVA